MSLLLRHTAVRHVIFKPCFVLASNASNVAQSNTSAPNAETSSGNSTNAAKKVPLNRRPLNVDSPLDNDTPTKPRKSRVKTTKAGRELPSTQSTVSATTIGNDIASSKQERTTAVDEAGTAKKRTKKPKPSKPQKGPPRTLDPNAHNVLDKHLARVQALAAEPVLADLEQHSPTTRPKDPTSPEYLEEYTQLTERLCYMFSKDQITRFAEQLDIGRPSWNKHALARGIITEKWGWPDPQHARRKFKERTEIATRDVDMSFAEIFVAMGKDGSDLLKIQARYHVHISLLPGPSRLRGEGLKADLDKFETHLKDLKDNMVHGEMHVPSKHGQLPDDLHESISRQAGAFISRQRTDAQVEGGFVQMYAKSAQALAAAKRLVGRAVHDIERNMRTPVLAYVPQEIQSAPLFPNNSPNQQYSVFPFLSAQKLPWMASIGGAYRVRRVTNYLTGNRLENVTTTGGLAGGRGVLSDINQVPHHLLQHLCGSETDIDNFQITATLGHVVWIPPKLQRESVLSGPLPGLHAIPSILAWLRGTENTKPPRAAFVASLPSALLNSTPAAHKVLLRLRYEMMHSTEENALTSAKNRVVLLEAMLSDASSSSTKVPSQGIEIDQANPSPDAGSLDLNSSHQCWVGTDNAVNVMAPDRPMDIKFSASDMTLVTRRKEPMPLSRYVDGLQKYLIGEGGDEQPNPPLDFRFNGDQYFLQNCSTVRQSTESLVALNGKTLPRPLQVKAEITMDIETQEKTSLCQLSLDGSDWSNFLSSCDQLSTSDSWSLTGTPFL